MFLLGIGFFLHQNDKACRTA